VLSSASGGTYFMGAFAEKRKASGQAVVRVSPRATHTIFERSWQENSAWHLQRSGRDQATLEKCATSGNHSHFVAIAGPVRGFDLSMVPVVPRSSSEAASGESKTAVRSADDDQRFTGSPIDKDPEAPKRKEAPVREQKKDTPTPAKKRAGVESFWTRWTAPSELSPTAPKLRLDFQAKFKDDATHDPALAEFRQFAFHKIKVTSGPSADKYKPDDTSPLHDDHYSRADDKANHDIHDVYFLSNDNPGPNELDKDDVIRYSFTADQRIIDISDNSVIKKLGPHTAGITGKHPRKTFGVPEMLSFGKV